MGYELSDFSPALPCYLLLSWCINILKFFISLLEYEKPWKQAHQDNSPLFIFWMCRFSQDVENTVHEPKKKCVQ